MRVCVVAATLVGSPAVRPATAATVAGGSSHTLVVRTTDRTLWVWGDNTSGQLGDGTRTLRSTPVPVTSLTGVVAVAAGARHSLALTSDGSVWAWGDNNHGQLGDGGRDDRLVPVRVLTGALAIAAGDDHSIALRVGGEVWTWGKNAHGELGDGGTTSRNAPARVSGLGLVAAIAGGGHHTLAVLQSGAIAAWGGNESGQLGDGSTAGARTPVPVALLKDAVLAEGGFAFSLAARFDGTLLAWGANASGQLGLGDTAERTTPEAVAGSSGAVAVAAGEDHALALRGDGSVTAWGSNVYGAVGDGSGLDRPTPVPVASLPPVKAVGAGRHHSVAVGATGEVWVWGWNNRSQLGDGTSANRLAPVRIAEAGFSWRVATPTFSPPAGTYGAELSVKIACATAGATLRYTTDGTEPDGSSPVYSKPLAVKQTTTLRAKAWKAGLSPSATAAATYELKVATPVLSPPGGSYSAPQLVSATTTTSGAKLRYTTDGSDPTAVSAVYVAPLGVTTTTTLKVAGFKAGWTTSDVAAATYRLSFGTLAPPVFAPPPALYVDSVQVAISGPAGAAVLYTTDGLDPTPSSALYTGPIGLVQTTTLKARAWQTDYAPSPITAGSYTIKVAPPVLGLAAGAYPPGTRIALTAATAGSSLHYTLSGADPTLADATIASGDSIAVGDFTLKVRAFKDGCEPSDVTAASYSLAAPQRAVAAGEHFSLALLDDGTVWAWGENSDGRLGDGTNFTRLSPTPILAGMRAIAAGSTHALALAGDGTVWTWGTNASGELGDGTTTGRSVPRAIGLTSIVAIAAGKGFSAAVRSDGTLYMWGENSVGQLGLGDSGKRELPAAVMTGVAGVGAGARHTLVLKTDARVWSWGANESGQLGDGTTLGRSIPAAVPGLSSVAAVTAGAGHSHARLANGSVYSWGDDASGQLGDGGTTPRSTPVLVGSLASVAAIDAGESHSLAATADGLVHAWGANASGQLGDATTDSRSAPLVVPGPYGVVAVAAGLGHSLAIADDGSLWAWGDNAFGELGDGTRVARLSPANVRQGSAWLLAAPMFDPPPGTYTSAQSVTITTATPDTLVRYTLDGSPIHMSAPFYAGPIPVPRTATLRAQAYKAGFLASPLSSGIYTIALAAAATPVISPPGGRLVAGRAVGISSPEIGVTLRYTTTGLDPTEADTVIASGGLVRVDRSLRLKARAWKSGLEPSAVATADFFVTGAVAAGSVHAVALRANGTVAAWGRNDYGCVGDGTSDRRMAPVDVPGLGDVVAIAAGQFHTLALKANGTVWSWGYNGGADGILGAGIPDPYRSSPVQVLQSGGPLSGVIAIAAGLRHSLALKSDGTVWAWGFGYYGALGLGGTGSAAQATRVPGLTGVTAIAAGGWHSLALGADRTLWAWGLNDSGQIGDGTTATRYSPVAVGDQVVVAGAGAYHTLIGKADGSLWGAGSNDVGQLGNGTTLTPQLTFAPALVGVGNVTKISASGSHTLALTATGEVWATGYNGQGQLGDGTLVNKARPVRVVLLHDVVDVAAGMFGQSVFDPAINHSLALTGDGRVWSWGSNYFGALGNGLTINDSRYRPQPIEGLSAADQSWLDGDPDGDGLATAEELRLGTDPFNADTNGDGIPDGAAVRSGLDAVGLDVDGDGIPNAVERARGTDPLRTDTDGDGVPDALDCYTLDPTRSACPVLLPGDVTPPVITLTEPASAVLVSSIP